MPTYEYRCPKGHEFELFQRMSDEPRATCPTCGEQAERLLSAGAGFLFKGEGFYITDYRSESYQKAAKAEQDQAGSGTDKKSTSGKTEAKKEETTGKSTAEGSVKASDKKGSPSSKKAD